MSCHKEKLNEGRLNVKINTNHDLQVDRRRVREKSVSCRRSKGVTHVCDIQEKLEGKKYYESSSFGFL